MRRLIHEPVIPRAAAGGPAVDVLLPTHARPHTIAHSVGSVLAQTRSDWSLHVVCDGCDDRTAGVVAALDDPRIRFHRFPKAPGFGYVNRNAVLRATSAPLVAYLTDDDLWFPCHLERALAVLAERSLDLVAFRSAHVQFPDVLDPHFFAFDWGGPASRFLRNWFTGPVAVVHRRSVFAAVGYWSESVRRFADREFHNRVRRSRPLLASAFVEEITSLRFFARHWERHYPSLPEAPQKRYLAALQDAEWRRRLAESARPGPRSLGVRRRQLRDFLAFAAGSGPGFARFWLDMLRSRGAVPRA